MLRAAPAILAVALFAVPARPATIHVPGDQPTIQAGLAVAGAGGTVLVAPGTYFENVTMLSGVTLSSEAGPTTTVIDGGGSASVVTCIGLSNAVVSGFTLQNGRGSGAGDHFGGGVYCSGCASTLVIERNLIRSCSAYEGGGIAHVDGSASILDNVIEYNVVTIRSPGWAGLGGGVHIGGLGSPLIARNVIRFNESDRAGSAINTHYINTPTIVDNIIYGNHDNGMYPEGNGAVFLDYVPVTCTGNTIVFNTGSAGIATITSPTIENCLIAFNEGPGVLVSPGAMPTVWCSDIFGNAGGDWVGSIAGQYGTSGNISADPVFCDVASWLLTLRSDSPCAPSRSGGCGLIGALDVGCGPVSLAPETWARIKAIYR